MYFMFIKISFQLENYPVKVKNEHVKRLTERKKITPPSCYGKRCSRLRLLQT